MNSYYVLFCVLLFGVPALGQDMRMAAPVAKMTVEPSSLISKNTAEHKFYDKTATIELAVAITADVMDTTQTCINLSHGGQEMWLPTQSCKGVTLILAGQLAAQEGAAYLLHKTHHHKLEKVIRVFTIQDNIRGIVYSKTH